MKPARADLERRRARVRRVNAKRPAPVTVTVRATYRPKPTTLDQLAELVLELLDERARSGAR